MAFLYFRTALDVELSFSEVFDTRSTGPNSPDPVLDDGPFDPPLPLCALPPFRSAIGKFKSSAISKFKNVSIPRSDFDANVIPPSDPPPSL